MFLFLLSKGFGENLRVLSNVDMHIYGFRILLFPAFSFVSFLIKRLGSEKAYDAAMYVLFLCNGI